MTKIAYFRVSTTEQSIESQRAALGGRFDKEFIDEGVSGSIKAADRKGFAELLAYVRQGDVVHVYSVDRLGRDAIDIQQTVRDLVGKGVALDVRGLGRIEAGVGELILAVLAQIADLERQKIIERTALGRDRARELLRLTGKTQHGAESLGRPTVFNADEIKAWRTANSASIAETAKHFKTSEATVKRACAKK